MTELTEQAVNNAQVHGLRRRGIQTRASDLSDLSVFWGVIKFY